MEILSRSRKKSDGILAVFFVSGLTGLIYESVWSHYVKLFLGHAAYAQTLVLVVFIGGLALGAWLCARVAGRLANPLRLYAFVEGAIGLMALVFHGVFVAAVSWGYAWLLPAACEPGTSVCVAQWLLSALLLAPQSILLGATFPLVSSAALRRDASEPGHDLAALYFLNTLGAVLGVLASAMVLIPSVGLPGTLRAAGAGNLLIAAIAFWMSRIVPPPLPPMPAAGTLSGRRMSESTLATLLLATAFFTGLSSFIYEIAWIRMLSLVLGASTHSFELMLASFLLGLALGGWWIRRRIDDAADPVRLLGKVQIFMGLAALATLPVYTGAFDLMAWILYSLARNDSGFVLFNASSTLIALMVMLPATFCAGMTLPLITFRLLRSPRGERALGLVYAVNTLGSILGVVIAVHVLLSWLGLRGTLVVGAAIDVLLGVVLLASLRRGRRFPLGMEAVAGLAALAIMGATFELDPRKLSSGVFRGGAARLSPDQQVIYHRDGKTATVDVLEGASTRSIRTNGKSDAAIVVRAGPPAADEYTMTLLAVLPLGHRPDARHAAVIGFGSGMSTHVLLGSPALERVDTIEIEPAMVEGARLFRPSVERAFSDPRSRVVIDDAKSFFARGGERYDIIVSEPSNPWVSGVASLFTREFYAQMSAYMNDGAVLAQWLHTYEMDGATFASIVGAVSETFGDFQIYSSLDSDAILIARKGGKPGPFDARVLSFAGLRPQLERLDLTDPELIRRRAVASAVVAAPFMKTFGMPANSDYYPVVDHRASRTRFTRATAMDLLEAQVSPVPMLEMFGAALVPSAERHPTRYTVISMDVATRMAWALHDAVLAGPAAAGDAEFDRRLATAYLVREWMGCRTGIAFRTLVPALAEMADAMNPRLNPAVAAEVWRAIGASPCGRALAGNDRHWLELFLALARRDADGMVDHSIPLLASKESTQGAPWDTALLAGVTGLVCKGDPHRARGLLERGFAPYLKKDTRTSEIRVLDAMTTSPPARCVGAAS